jgi:8-oxo-dGTP diphosphatase
LSNDYCEIYVCSAIIYYKGKYLVQERTVGKLYAGFWEFPGGKIQTSETPEHCISRELEEELGISPLNLMLLDTVFFEFQDGKKVNIRYYFVTEYKGTLIAKEKQRIRWCSIDQLQTLNLIGPDKLILNKIRKSNEVWDRVWSMDIYSSPRVREKRALHKIKKIVEMGFTIRGDDFILDLGCGSGEVSICITKLFNSNPKIYCLDSSLVAISLAKRNFERNGLKIKISHGDATALPYPSSFFDKIIAFGVMEHIKDEEKFLLEVNRVLKDKGEVYFCNSSKLSNVYLMRKIREALHIWPYGYQKNYSPVKLLSLLEKYFYVDKWSILQTNPDFPISWFIDSFINVLFRIWGRYIIIKCYKR